jgi:hypothetical protein
MAYVAAMTLSCLNNDKLLLLTFGAVNLSIYNIFYCTSWYSIPVNFFSTPNGISVTEHLKQLVGAFYAKKFHIISMAMFYK